MRFAGSRAISRRAVAWDPEMGVLTVGERSVSLTCAEGDNECILRTYLHLVAEQRDVALGRSVVLRRDDVLVLAELLDLDDVRLERQLASILRLSDPEARELRRELLRHRVTVAALGVGLAAALPLGVVAAAAEAPQPAAAAPAEPDTADLTNLPGRLVAITVEAPTTVVTPTTVPAPSTGPVVTTAAAPAPTPEPAADAPVDDGTEIGYTVTYERDPDDVPPEGVEIGDAMVIERDLPDAG